MSRTNAIKVRAVVETDCDLDLSIFITTASSIVDSIATCASAKNKTLTSSQLTDIETWLAAHLYSIRDQPYASKSTGQASASFQGKTGMYLDSTHWGQTAMLLDTSGCLSIMNSDLKAGRKNLLV